MGIQPSVSQVPMPATHKASGEVSYNPDTIWQIGQEIVENAAAAQDAHDAHANPQDKKAALTSYVATAPPAVNGFPIIQNLLTTHASRLGQRNGSSSGRGSYDWQVQMGNTLKFIADGIREADQNWANSFKAIVPQ